MKLPSQLYTAMRDELRARGLYWAWRPQPYGARTSCEAYNSTASSRGKFARRAQVALHRKALSDNA